MTEANKTQTEANEERNLAQQAEKDEQAFGELYRRYCKRVYAYHLARTGNVLDAQDLTSQTFVSAYEGIAGYRGMGSFAAWLFGIAYRKYADHYRARKSLLPLEAAEDETGVDPGMTEIVEGNERMKEIGQALRRLAPERSEALLLRIFSELSVAETGEVMGKSEAAVKMLTYRALKDVRKILAATLQEEV